MQTSPLHISQKFFWFVVSFCLAIGTGFFCWRLAHDVAASIKLFGVEITCDTAQKSVQATRDRLLAIQTRLRDAAEQDDLATIQQVLPDIDDILKTLGVAEGALKRQQNTIKQWGGGFDTYWSYSDYGTYYYPGQTATPAKTKK